MRITESFGYAKTQVNFEPEIGEEALSKMTKFRKKNEKILKEKFSHYLSRDTKLAGICDYFMIMRDFFSNEEFTFFFNPHDIENIFEMPNSLKLLTKKFDEYFFCMLRTNKKIIKNSKYAEMDFEFFWLILEYLLNTNFVHILPKRDIEEENFTEKYRKFEDFGNELEYTLEHYRKLFNRAQTEHERLSINDFITTILMYQSGKRFDHDGLFDAKTQKIIRNPERYKESRPKIEKVEKIAKEKSLENLR